MKIDKIKEILKNKRVQIMAGTVAGVLILTIAGNILVHNKFNGENKTEDSKVVTVNKKKDNKDSKDENKIEENSSNEITSNEETKTEDTKSESSSNITNENTSNSNTTSSDTTSKTSSSTSNSTSSTGSSSNNSTSNTTSTHTHNWVEVYKDVYHAEEGHYENVLVKEAWIETVPVYEEQYRAICNTCGADITGNEGSHMRNHMLNGENGSYKNVPMQVQTGTNTINHDAVYEQKWVVDRASWTEQVLSGYKCSSCGETK